MMESSIDRSNYLHISHLIRTAQFDKAIRTKAASIWDIQNDDSSYSAIMSALGLDPYPLPSDARLVSIPSQENFAMVMVVEGKAICQVI